MIKRRGGIGRKDAGKQAGEFLRLGLRAPSARTRDAWGNRYKVIDAGNGKIIVKARPYRSPAPNVPESVMLWMEHGWRALDQYGLGTVYLHASMAAYYAAAGTTLPDSLGTDHLVGRLTAAPEEYVPTWPDDPPTVGDDDEHASLICTELTPCAQADWDTRRPAHEYSGLTRAWVQALHGAGRRVSDVLPAGWDTTSLGIQRGPDGTYWAFAAGSGLTARRLEHWPELAVLAGWCEDGELTGEDRLRGDVYVLGWLRQPVGEDGQPDPDEIDLGSLADAYDLGDDRSGSGIAGRGWAWRQQVRGASDEHVAGAVLCPITSVGANADWRLWSARSVLTVQWDAETGRPTGCTVSQTAPVEWVPDGATLWAAYTESDGQASVCLNMDMRRPLTCTYRSTATAYWAAWYDAGGAVVSCEWQAWGIAADIAGGNPCSNGFDPVPFCPGASASKSCSRGTGVLREQVRVGPAETREEIGGTVQYVAQTETASAPEWSSGSGQPAAAGTYGTCQTTTVPEWVYYDEQAWNPWWTHRAYSVVEAQTDQHDAFGLSGWRAVILPPDPQCAWLTQSYEGTRGGTHFWNRRSVLVGERWSRKRACCPDYLPGGEWLRCLYSRGQSSTAPAPAGCYDYTASPLGEGGVESAPALWPDVRLWYVGADGAAQQIDDDQAEDWATVLGALGLSVPCTDSVAAGVVQSAGGRVLAAGVDDGGLSAAGAATAGRWVGGV